MPADATAPPHLHPQPSVSKCSLKLEVGTGTREEAEISPCQVPLNEIFVSVKQVAFSASLMDSGSGDVGPFNTKTPLVFRRVVTNIGNAYNPNTGFFIAPVRGVYHFSVLFKNGENTFMAYEYQPSNFASTTNSITLLLKENTRVFDNHHHHTTFSGHLIFTM
uniref:C1q domain-containing protein n=1 Tax=Nothobranchius furzeri TaxID=105023 RepID=A0A8C6MGB8_NOTFU